MECEHCPKKFKQAKNCYRHMWESHDIDGVAEKKRSKAESCQTVEPFNFQRDVERNCFKCFHCSLMFVSSKERDRHEKSHFDIRPYACDSCGKMFKKHIHCKMHKKSCGVQPTPSQYVGGSIIEENDEDEFILEKSALRGVAEMYKLNFSEDETELFPRLQEGMRVAYRKLTTIQRDDKNIKYYISLKCRFYKPTDPDVITDPPVVFNSETCSLLPTSNIKEEIEINYLNIDQQVSKYVCQGSGWVLLNLISLNLNVIRYDPLKASSYIDLPKKIKNKKACINIHNDDKKCFVWSILAHFHPINYKDHPNRVSHYQQFENELDMTHIEYPVQLNKIQKFEKQNNISINIFGLDQYKKIVPVQITDNKLERHVNLLFLSNSKNNHYALIKDMSRLLAGQINKRENRKYICDYCLHGCTTAAILEKHVERCKEHRAQLTVYPEPGTKLKFTKFGQQLPLPLYFVADVETVQQPITTVHPDPSKSSTTKTANHLPCSASYMPVFADARYSQSPKVFKGDNCLRQFLDYLQTDVAYYKECYSRGIELVMTKTDQAMFDAATDFTPLEQHCCESKGDSKDLCGICMRNSTKLCHICSKEFNPPEEHCHKEGETETNCKLCVENLNKTPVRDHDHVSGCFRGTAHSICNLQYGLKPDKLKISVFFHNLKGYDAHLILSHANPKKHGKITCIPKTIEQYISFTIGDIVFKDSLAFMGKGLDDLVKTLQPEELKLTQRYIQEYVSRNKNNSSNLGLYDESSAMTVDVEIGGITLNEISAYEDEADEATCPTTHLPTKKRKTSHFLYSMATCKDDEESDDDEEESEEVSRLSSSFIDDTKHEQNDCSFYRYIDNKEQQRGKKRKRDIKDHILYYSIKDLPDNDYRRHPYDTPILTGEQTREVEEKFKLMKEKGVYPYEYISSLSILDENQLPLQETFYSSLKDKNIKDKQYNRAQNVWDEFEMKTLWNYHDLYLIMDILLLADVLNAFRGMCLKNYNIDPLHSYTAPGFAWQAALKMTNVELELLSDKDQYLFFEAAKRGGICVISYRHAKSNIPNHTNFNKSDPASYLMYLDANNLYGWALIQYLPIGEFKWVKINLEDVLNTPDDSNIGYSLEVDLHYPDNLHEKHNEYPLAPEKIRPPLLSEYQKDMLRAELHSQHPTWSDMQVEKNIDSRQTLPKLIPNLKDKTKYVVDYRLLKFYVSMGLKVTKVHRVLQYAQAPWLKPFIDFNTQMRAASQSEFEKDFFKLLNNSVFGKIMQNTREYRKIDLVASEKKALKLSAQPTFRSYNIFHENLIAVERYQPVVKMDKPIFVGISALELSKWLMYDFHYNFIKKQYPGERSKLCFTDTDSFLYILQTEDVYADILANSERFDLSEYKEDHQIFNGLCKEEIRHLKKINKKVVGKIKDELKGNKLLEFVGLRAKAYSYRFEKDVYVDQNGNEVDEQTAIMDLVIKEVKKLKGIKKCVVESSIHFEQYKQCLLEGIKLYVEMKTFRSYDHRINTISQNKQALSRFDDKRWILDDGISTLAHGHYKTLESNI